MSPAFPACQVKEEMRRWATLKKHMDCTGLDLRRAGEGTLAPSPRYPLIEKYANLAHARDNVHIITAPYHLVELHVPDVTIAM
jgi:hypothetical protein